MIYYNNTSELYHHGIKGQKWGVRRFENPDGTLTEAGKKRYSDSQKKQDETLYGKRAAKRIEKRVNSGESLVSARHPEVIRKEKSEKRKQTARRILKPAKDTAITVAGTALVAMGATAALKWANGQKVQITKLPKDTIDMGKQYLRNFGNNAGLLVSNLR